MSVRMELIEVTGLDKNMFRPMPLGARLKPFQMWSMEMLYACLYHESIGETTYEVKDVMDCCVWNGNELYNTEYQIFPDKNKQSRIWLTEHGFPMLELIADDFDTPDEVYRVH